MEPKPIPNGKINTTCINLINENKEQLINDDNFKMKSIVDKFFDGIAMEIKNNITETEVTNKIKADNRVAKRKEVFMKWNCISHLQLWHNNEDDSIIHFPWADMSCALDSTLSAYWIIYLRLQLRNEWLILFREEFPKIVEVFDELYEIKIHNIQAKEKLRALFKINDARWNSRNSVEVMLVTDFLKEKLTAFHANGEESLFQWVFKVYWVCKPCGIQTCHKYDHGNYKGTDIIHRRDNIAFQARSCKFTVHESIEHFLADSVRNISCEKCMSPCTIFRETITHPYILHVSYPFLGKGALVDLPNFVEEELSIGEVVFDLVGVVYGDGIHFVFRFLKDGKVYEADGMQHHSTSKHKKIVRSALSREILGCHKISLAGHIDWSINKDNELVDGRKIVDIYYLKR